ncbi:CpaF/VirB11 family protein [Paenibacillus larvae]|uniref:ATPase, T2SS/T4P/T4SS family n=1 Tax=Paenibacillus larvae TaxID=1464 RepID=UPI002281AB3F|nr:ATPase, T2SS/T4P/T4SS family [Paenibacillus larvae]MCY9511140.1 CpaF/VirB11 family protein [Paenibacillus larvae]MCY9525745.1 CpaF/VirB11 family protein [Paenibacillus larvae]
MPLFSWINLGMIVLVLITAGGFLYVKLTRNHIRETKEEAAGHIYSLETITDFIMHALNEMTDKNLYDLDLTEEEFRRNQNKRILLKRALKGCSQGDYQDKMYVKQLIADLLVHAYGINEETIQHVLPFKQTSMLSYQDKFEILLYMYKKKHGFQALSIMIDRHQLDEPKFLIEGGHTESYLITKKEIDFIFNREYVVLPFEDELQIVAQRVYQRYKGYGVVDEIRDMAIDGVSGGVSGLLSGEESSDMRVYVNQFEPDLPYAHDSVWIFYKGKSIHLEFLSFGSKAELKRVCQNLYKYNHPGQLSETSGYIVNEMKDGSRIVVVRPGFAETWSFFVRKFDLPNASLEQLIQGKQADLPIRFIQYLMKGSRITAVTGAQGSGKTTLLMAMIKYIYGAYTLRVQEMAFELQLRKIYRQRNIVSFRETKYISGQEGLDIQKKTDGTVHILGEVANDEVAAWMIQMSQVASLFTLFTHHAKTFRDLISSLRNSLLKTGVFHHERIAEQQVVQVINFDIHLQKDRDGYRYIERITECVPIEQDEAYPDEYRRKQGVDAKFECFLDTAPAYFEKSTNTKLYEARNIIEYRDGAYVPVHPISASSFQEMFGHMTQQDKDEFQAFLEDHWGRGQQAG